MNEPISLTQRKAEQAINHYLQATLRTYLILKKKGKDELANALLVAGSAHADFCLEAAGIRKTYMKVSCPRCRRLLSSAFDIISVKGSGRCLSCDHIEGD